jgi:hypothetical protein
MPSLAKRFPVCCLLAAALVLLCPFALSAAPAAAPDFCVVPRAPEPGMPQAVAQLAAYVCGAAGQRCCPLNTCNSGLVCNANGICRTPCGLPGQSCCPGNQCTFGTCNTITYLCQ